MSSKCTCMPHICHVHTRFAQYMCCQCTQCHNMTICAYQSVTSQCSTCDAPNVFISDTRKKCALNLVCTVCTWRAWGIHVHLEDILQWPPGSNRSKIRGLVVDLLPMQIVMKNKLHSRAHLKNIRCTKKIPVCTVYILREKIQVCACRAYTHGPRKKNRMHFGYRGAEK